MGERYYLLSKKPATFDKGMCMWWRPNAAGYTIFLDKAGTYDEATARRLCTDGDTFAVPVELATKMSAAVVYVDYKQALIDGALTGEVVTDE